MAIRCDRIHNSQGTMTSIDQEEQGWGTIYEVLSHFPPLGLILSSMPSCQQADKEMFLLEAVSELSSVPSVWNDLPLSFVPC